MAAPLPLGSTVEARLEGQNEGAERGLICHTPLISRSLFVFSISQSPQPPLSGPHLPPPAVHRLDYRAEISSRWWLTTDHWKAQEDNQKSPGLIISVCVCVRLDYAPFELMLTVVHSFQDLVSLSLSLFCLYQSLMWFLIIFLHPVSEISWTISTVCVFSELYMVVTYYVFLYIMVLFAWCNWNRRDINIYNTHIYSIGRYYFILFFMNMTIRFSKFPKKCGQKIIVTDYCL